MSVTLKRIVALSKKDSVHQLARKIGQEVFFADDLNDALDITQSVNPQLAIFDGDISPDIVRRYNATADNISNVPVIIIDDRKNQCESAEREFIEAGATQYLNCPEDDGKIEQLIDRLQGKKFDDTPGLQTDRYFADDFAASVSIVGKSFSVKNQLNVIKLVAKSRCNPILIVGETGTGKELAARAVHSIRSNKEPFVAINCAALTANLLESELFGHVKGSFTGADRDKVGLLELAASGVVFLDEISEMPLDLQAKLLRLIQEKEFRRVGSVETIRCNASIIASSNRDLKKEVQAGRFRSDLYYRLCICPIIIEPIRSPNRKQDISILAQYFIKTSEFCPEKCDRITGITSLALEALEQYDWPGNVRHLKNVIDRAILLENTDKIGLSSIVIDDFSIGQNVDQPLLQTTDFSLEKAERQLIAKALQQTNWQKTQAAALLGISRATLYVKLEQYKLKKYSPPTNEICQPACEKPSLVAG
jgi:transcriptional regulator with PAS, ATPase and Fis domain